MRPTVGEALAHDERRWAVRRRAFSTKRNFLPTCIRDRDEFSGLGRAKSSSFATVLLARVAETPVVPRASHAMTRRAPALSARITAVFLPAVVSPADHEGTDAPATRQLENWNGRLAQGSGCDRQKFGGNPSPWDEWFVERPALGLRPKARGCDSGLHSFRCAFIIEPSEHAGHFPAGVVPWSPVIPVEVVPPETGGDKRERAF
jgi:hypothetical protein